MSTALGRLDDGTIVRADCPVQYPPHAPAHRQGPAFTAVPAVIIRAYTQFDPHGLPPRPTGAPREFAAGDRASLFRCEFRALMQARAARIDLTAPGAVFVTFDESGQRIHVPFSDLVQAVAEALAADLAEALAPALAEQLQDHLDAHNERKRDYARMTLPSDRFAGVKQ